MKRVPVVDDQTIIRQRLIALAEFSLNVARETERQPLLDTFVSAACRIADADGGAVVVVESSEVVRIATWGTGMANDSVLAALRDLRSADEQAIREALAHAGVRAGACAVVVMPVTRTVDARLILIRSEEGPFTADDRALAATLSAQAAITYDNLMLHDALMKSERGTKGNLSLLRATLESTADGIVVVDHASGVTAYNQRFVEMWRIPAAVLESRDAVAHLNHATTQLLEPDDFLASMKTLRLDGVSEVAGRAQMKDGRVLEWYSAPQLLEDRSVGRVLTFRDVTSTVRATDALRSSENKYRTLLVHLPGVKWTADQSGRVLYVSPSIVNLIGYTSEEIYGDARAFFTRLIHPDDRERADRAYRQLFEESKPFEVEYRVLHKNGRWVWIHNHAVTAYERGGTRVADGVATDVTARAQAEAEKGRLSRERDLLLASAAEGILGLDTDGQVSFVNPAAAAILGYSPEELPGGNAHDLFHVNRPDPANRDESCSLCAAQLAGVQGRVKRVTLWRKDHSPVEVEMVVAPVVDEGHVRGSVLVFSDVTERNLLERRLEQTSRVASLGRVAATIAHEFNNVLMGIQPFAEIVRRTAAGNERLLNAAEHITKAVQRGKRIAQEILRFTRPATPMMKPVEAVQALNELVQELNEGLPPTCRVVLDAPDRPVAVLADWPQLEQVIANLVINARDAMDGHGVVTITVDDKATNGAKKRVREPEKYVHLQFTDTGAGMSPEVAGRIFEPLFTTKKTGTGLGLAVAQQVVAGHGGEIWVESKPGEGTTFHVLIPRSHS